MKPKRKLLWIACPLILVLLLVSVTILAIAEGAEPPEPSVSIEKFNLSFEDHVFLKYAVKLNEADAVQLGSENFRLLFWTAPHATYEKGTENSSVSVLGTTKISGEDYYTFAYTELAAKQMADTVYARAYINVGGNVYYSDVEKYSIVQYAYDVFHSETATQELKTLVSEMLSYGAAAQDYFNYNESRPANGTFLQIEVTNGTLEDGFSKGLYLKDETFTLSAPETDAKGNYFSHWVNAKGETIFKDNIATLIVGETEEVYTAVYVQTTSDEYFNFVENNGSPHLNGTYMIYAKDINNLPSNIVIPCSYNGKPVTALGIDAFKNCTNLTNIIIPESIIAIGDSAFSNCTNLTQITFSENSQLTRIGYCSFENCSSLESITIPNTVTTIDVYAFWKCKKLTMVTFGENSRLTDIRFNAFVDCESLESITIPNNVINIESSVFSGCKSLTNIVIPDNVTSVGDYAFSGCKSLTNIIIPDNVTSIGDYAFSGCRSLTNIIIPDKVKTIGNHAFSGCEKLTNIVIPNNVINIGEGAFAFSAIKSITLPNNITSIGKETFEYCDKLTNIMIPDSVITIGYKAFANCENLETVTFGERSQLTSIDSAAFIACTKLTAITIPRGLISIGEAAFSSCTNLSNIYYLGTATEWDSISIDTSNNPITATTIYYYSKTAPTTEGNYWYYNENGNPSIWEPIQATDSDYFVFTELSDGTYSIKAKDINNMPANVIIPSNYNGRNVTKIDESAFSRCRNLTNIIIPDNIISIGYYAFNECDSLESVTLSNRLVSIGAYTFNACRSLGSITIPNSVTSIGNSAFNDCSGLTSITISKNVTSIGRYAFSDCTGLTNIMIPNSVTSIDDFAFWGCTALACFMMGTDVTFVGDYTFGACDNLKDIYYFGTADDWSKISIGSFNDSITNAIIYYYSATAPTTEGNYWQYDENGVPTKW